MSETSFTPRVFSGIQPSGGLTLGNYLGAIKRFVAEQGHDMGRPGRAEVEVLGPPDDVAGVRVTGTGVVVLRGTVDLP